MFKFTQSLFVIFSLALVFTSLSIIEVDAAAASNCHGNVVVINDTQCFVVLENQTQDFRCWLAAGHIFEGFELVSLEDKINIYFSVDGDPVSVVNQIKLGPIIHASEFLETANLSTAQLEKAAQSTQQKLEEAKISLQEYLSGEANYSRYFLDEYSADVALQKQIKFLQELVPRLEEIGIRAAKTLDAATTNSKANKRF